MIRRSTTAALAAVALALAGCTDDGGATDDPTTGGTASAPADGTATGTGEPAEPVDDGRTFLVPRGFTLPVTTQPEWQVDEDDEEVAVETVGATNTPWALTPCDPTDYPSDADRTGFAGAMRASMESGENHQVATYDDSDAAQQAVDEMLAALEECSETTADEDDGGWTTAWTVEETDGGFTAVAAIEDSSGEAVPGSHVYVVQRRNNAVALSSIAGDIMAERGEVPADVVEPLAEEVQRSLESLTPVEDGATPEPDDMGDDTPAGDPASDAADS